MKLALEVPSPDSRSDLDDIAEKVLRHSGAEGSLPTNLDAVAESLRLDVLNINKDESRNFLTTLSLDAANTLRSGLSKLRGIADLRSNVIAIPEETNFTDERKRFAEAHEISHQVIPWHRVRQTYLDDGETLMPAVKAEFEREANCVAASLLFQGNSFLKLIRDYRPTIANIKAIAGMHKASFHATIWRFVEQYDERVAVAFYYPSNKQLGLNSPSFNLWCGVGSKTFNEKYAHVDIPALLDTQHPWVENARVPALSNYFDSFLKIDAKTTLLKFYAQAYWNRYNLFVFWREVPRGRAIRQLSNILSAQREN